VPVPVANSGTVRFGAFEADLRSGELRKDGIRVKLEGQPFQVLAALLERPGQLVTREELQKELWPSETFVDFEQGINAAVKRLRVALEDSAENPRFIETLPRRGYRFIARVAAHPPRPQTEGPAEPGTEVGAVPEPAASSGLTDSSVPAPSARGTRVPWALTGLGILLALFFAVMRFWNPAAIAPTAAGAEAAPASPPRPTVIIQHPSANLEANELLQQAVFLIRFQFEPLRARSMLERALQLDPNFTEARTYYALTHIIAVEGGISNDPGDIFRAEEELRRALQADPQLALAHAMLGAAHFFHGQMDLAGEEYQQALRLTPGDLAGEVWSLIHARFLGNEEASRAAQKLVTSEPLFWPFRYVLGELFREQGKTAEAMRAYEPVLEEASQNSTVLLCVARAYLDAGNLPKARQALERLRPQDAPNFRVRMTKAQLHALEGKRALALKDMDEELLRYADLWPFAALDAAEVYATLGETDKAIEWLDRSMRKGDGRVDWMRIDPLLANVRQAPRFEQILSSMEFRSQRHRITSHKTATSVGSR
jgi:DNA-binding winged helix-turn-helix (wHTH) protein/Tfp pilus assembly protein PilF